MLALRRRLPYAWRRGTPVEKFLYNSTHYFALALAGFAASSFFVSFAWLDIIYMVMALITGLYVSVQVYQAQLAAVAADGAVPDLGDSVRRPGWRVDRSVRRAAAAAVAVRPT
jgi:hypothetical protein